MRKAYEVARWLWRVLRNPVLEWVDPQTEEIDEVERISRRQQFRWFMPSWLQLLGTRTLDCGCVRRIRIVRYRWGCPRHSV